jgi:CO dehydrogenase/acetyl-CoA synthase alpha subunit
MLSEKKDQIPDEDKEKVNKLMADGKAITGKEDATKEEIDTEIERIQKEFAELYNKYQAAPAAAPDTDTELQKDKEGKEENKEE